MKTRRIPGTALLALCAVILVPLPSIAQTDTASINHRWVWECSIGGLSGRDTLTPGKAGYCRSIQFMKNGKFREFRNDSLLASTRFVLRREKTIFSEDSLRVFRFADSARFPPRILWNVTPDTLELGDNHVEPFGHRYRRSGK